MEPKKIACHFRMKITSENGIQDVAQYFQDNFDRYILAGEFKPGNDHIHVLFDLTEEDVSSRFRMFRPKILEQFKIKGNKDYSLSICKDLEATKRYILKEGLDHVKYKGYTPEDIELWSNQSYKKFSKNDFARDLENLRLEFLKPTASTINGSSFHSSEWLFSQLLRLKAKYNQKINTTNLEQIVLLYLSQQSEENLNNLAQGMDTNFRRKYFRFEFP